MSDVGEGMIEHDPTPSDAEWAARIAEADRQWATHRDREIELLPLNKAALFEALVAADIGSVVVTFDGSGDSGQIEQVSATTSGDQQAELPTGTVAHHGVQIGEVESAVTMVPVREMLEYLVYSLLERTHGGWENDDGAYGEFTFDVTTRSITLQYNERYIATEFHEHKF